MTTSAYNPANILIKSLQDRIPENLENIRLPGISFKTRELISQWIAQNATSRNAITEIPDLKGEVERYRHYLKAKRIEIIETKTNFQNNRSFIINSITGVCLGLALYINHLIVNVFGIFSLSTSLAITVPLTFLFWGFLLASGSHTPNYHVDSFNENIITNFKDWFSKHYSSALSYLESQKQNKALDGNAINQAIHELREAKGFCS